jgi:hypothetical protein
MTGRRGISGEEIRREQEQSRRRSRLGSRAVPSDLQPSSSLTVTWIEIDWGAPVLACAIGTFGSVSLAIAIAIAIAAIGLDFFSSKTITIQSGAHGVRAIIKKPWRGNDRTLEIVIDTPQLHYWNAWSCGGFELRGANVSIVATSRRWRQLAPPSGVPAVAVRPRLRPNGRAILLSLPNILVAGATLAFAWHGGWSTLGVMLLALNAIASSVACCLRGGPELLVLPSDDERVAPPTDTAEAA